MTTSRPRSLPRSQPRDLYEVARAPVPTRAVLDRTIALFGEGYLFLPERYRRWHARAFETRLFGRRAVCMAGREAVRLFYDGDRIEQSRFMPGPIGRILFGDGAVHFLEGDAHHRRKAMFLSLVTPAAVAELGAVSDRLWDAAADRWANADRVVLFGEAVQVLGAAALTWAGVPLERADVPRLSRDLATIVDGFGSVGLRLLRARRARTRCEHWARALVADVRAGRLRPPAGSALDVIPRHRDSAGRPLDDRVAAVELLNVVRPTVAVAYFVTFAAHAMHLHPEWRPRLASGDPDVLAAFAYEVRRFYPFAPALASKARREFVWRGHRFTAGRLVVLDVFGTCRDEASWHAPERFDPYRFIARRPDPLAWVPHGEGDPRRSHHCPGEDLTTELLVVAERHLARLRYDTPPQDLRVPLSRMPTRPRSGFVMTDVQRVATGVTVTA